jgi:hypothetical protein
MPIIPAIPVILLVIVVIPELFAGLGRGLCLFLVQRVGEEDVHGLLLIVIILFSHLRSIRAAKSNL